MSDHYYTTSPSSKHEEKVINIRLQNHDFQFITDSGVFSKNRMDFGSELLFQTFIEQVNLQEADRILELGSGYGPIILGIAKVFPNTHCIGLEINDRAYDLSKRNAKLNGINNVEWIHGEVTELALDHSVKEIITNPPFRAGKKVVHQFIDVAYQQLASQGSLWVVVQRKQGAPSLSKHMEAVFGNVNRVALKKGYWILKSKKQ